MITEGKVANALGGKTARACDSCLKKRARWFCVADDAFLCQACDVSVHSANQLASRHERVRLETSSSKATEIKRDQNSQPTWHKGFTRKPRTPRNTKPSQVQVQQSNKDQTSLVPEISNDQISVNETHHDDQEQLLFSRVPVFDSFAAKICTDIEVQNMQAHDEGAESFSISVNELDVLLKDDHQDLDIPELNASDAELDEFAADVENLLGKGLEEDLDGVVDVSFEDERAVKFEDDEDDHQEVQEILACHFNPSLDMATKSLNWDCEYSSSSPVTGEEEVKVTLVETPPLKDIGSQEAEEERRMMLLKLNYEEVITAWASQGSPWADGAKPDEFQPHDHWPNPMKIFQGISHRKLHNLYGAGGGLTNSRDEEREARVLRYREKRRTRLFSKKIRYEVRKLNAEKRPRIKGRFVKRSSFGGPSFPYLMHKSS